MNNIKCRWCSEQLKEPNVVLPNMPLTDQFINLHDFGKEFLADIAIYTCTTCGLIQNPNNFDFSDYYENYNYSSGHSEFVKKFMRKIADSVISTYTNTFGRMPRNVMEVGSGDGVQLAAFQDSGLDVLGVEPSEQLQATANQNGIHTLKVYFEEESIKKNYFSDLYDITFSSYTLDHIPNPRVFLDNIWRISSDQSLLVFEIHDIEKIVSRGEWCLFEHEHMIYTEKSFWEQHLNDLGFEIVCVNPLPDEDVRANSMIVIAKKIKRTTAVQISKPNLILELDPNHIEVVKQRLEDFIETTEGAIIGWGIGGRGIMTTALLSNYDKISAFFDSNANETGLFTPKSQIPIMPMSTLRNYKGATVIVFSFGYFDEIKSVLLHHGFNDERIISLREFYS